MTASRPTGPPRVLTATPDSGPIPPWVEPAIAAASQALQWAEVEPYGDLRMNAARAGLIAAQAALGAAVPLISAWAAEQALTQAAANLTAWADEDPDPDWSSPRAARRRTLHAAARKITPKMTDAQAAQAFVDLLAGRTPGFVCNLDAVGRPVPPGTDGQGHV